MRSSRGFSLIELMVVLAVAMILATLAIIHVLKARVLASETAAVGAVRTILQAQTSYAATYPELGYAPSLTALGPGSGTPTAAAAGLVDSQLASGSRQGYTFALTASGSGGRNDAFELTAVPQAIGRTGNRGFCGDQTNVIKYSADGSTTCLYPLKQ